ncbi:MAG: hypothetical protein AYK19_08835 [Theionarchaea archaeon DG-70-1]|nr:MAG: hypothetical protein AYK19_08835 [Theionarchaea archaeon DG-70-1]
MESAGTSVVLCAIPVFVLPIILQDMVHVQVSLLHLWQHYYIEPDLSTLGHFEMIRTLFPSMVLP